MTVPTSPHDIHVLGGIRAIDDTIAAEPVPERQWSWRHVAVLGAIFFVLGIVCYNLAGATS